MASVPGDDMVEEVVVRSSAKCIGRFRCVSRSWNTRISNPSFRNRLFDRYMGQLAEPNVKLMLCNNDVRFLCFLYKNNDYSPYFVSDSMDEALRFNPTSKFYTDKVEIHGSSCKGLLLVVSRANGSIFLWNPTTGASKTITSRGERCIYGYENYYMLFGFGYDPLTQSCKILSLRTKTYKGTDQECVCLVELFKTSTRSWKGRSNDWWIPYAFEARQQLTLVNGNLHGLATKHPRSHHFGEPDAIVYFDISTEEFGEMLLPDYAAPGDHASLSDTTSLNGYLCLVVSLHKRSFNIWVMMEYGVRESWNKMFCIQKQTIQECINQSVCFVLPTLFKNGQLLLCTTNDYDSKIGTHMVLYDPTNKKAEIVSISGAPNRFSTKTYVETRNSPHKLNYSL